MEGDMFCYIHEDSELVKCAGGSIEYKVVGQNALLLAGICHILIHFKIVW